MNKKKSLFITVGLVGLIIGSTLLYNVLAKDFEESNNENVVAVEEQTAIDETLTAEEITDETATEVAAAGEANEDLTEEDTAPSEDELTVMGSETTNNSAVKPTKVPTENVTSTPAQGVTNAPTQGAGNSAPTTTVEPTKAPAVAPTKAPEYNVPTSTPVPTKAPAPTATPVPTKAPANVNTAANFTVQTYSGSNVSLSSNFGKPIVVNFWASWCGPCKSEMPDFNSVYQEYKDKVVFMMVDMVDGSRETKQSGYNYVTGQGFSFPVDYDVNQSAAYAYGINSYPTTYFIDANGNVSTYSKGAMSASTLRSKLNQLIAQ